MKPSPLTGKRKRDNAPSKHDEYRENPRTAKPSAEDNFFKQMVKFLGLGK